MRNWRYELLERGTERFVYTRRFLGTPALMLGILTFPFGIVFWIAGRRRRELEVVFEPAEAGSRWAVKGYMTTRMKAKLTREGFRYVNEPDWFG